MSVGVVTFDDDYFPLPSDGVQTLAKADTAVMSAQEAGLL
jgi:hypothetical protein